MGWIRTFCILGGVLCCTVLTASAQDYLVTAPYISPVRNTCGAGNDCDITGTDNEDHTYQVTIPLAGNWTFSLCESAYDTKLAVGTTLCGEEVGYNDDYCGVQSQITANIGAGTYYVVVDGYSTYCGEYILNIWRGGADYVVAAPYTSPTRTTCGAGNDCGLRPAEEHIYQITIPYTSTWSFNTCLHDDLDTYIFVGTGMCTQDIGSNDDACGPYGYQSEVIATIPAGTYYCTVEGYYYCGEYILEVYDTLAGGDYHVAAPYTSPLRSTCGAGDDCNLVATSPDHEYQVTIPYASTWNFNTCLYADLDTYIFVGTSLCTADIGENDDSCGLQSEVIVDIPAGTYYCTIEHYCCNTCGNYIFDVYDIYALPNDNCVNAIPIYDGATAYDTTGATTDGPAHPECQYDGQTYHDIWYEYVATCTGDLTVSMCQEYGGDAWYDTDLVVYDGCDCDNLVLLGCNDDALVTCTASGTSYASHLVVPVVQGGGYLIRIGGYYPGDMGAGIVSISCQGVGPPNDDCVNATPIGDVGDLPFDTTGATLDGPGYCVYSENIWYCYTATCTGMMSVDTCGSSFDTMIAVYDGCDCDPIGPMLCCNDDHCCEGEWTLQSRCNVWVEQGREYLIEVGGCYAAGPGDLTVRCQPCDYYFDAVTWQGGGNGWPYPDGPGEWIWYPEWVNMWWPNEFDLDRQKRVRIEFDVEFPCAPGEPYGWLEVVINWSTPNWTDPAAPPTDDAFVERAPDPPLYFMDPGHYEFEMMLPYCPAWVSMDVRGELFVISGTIVHVCEEPGPPPNDDCVNATPIGDVGDLPFDTTNATFDGPGYCQDAPNVWYCYTATCTGMMSVDTCGSSYDTIIAVYDGCDCDPIGSMLCCNDDHCCEGDWTLQSRCLVWVEQGRQYLIEVGGCCGYVGPGDLTVRCQPCEYFFDGVMWQGGGNGWPYPDGPGEWIYYPSDWWNMWWPNEFDLDRQKLVRIEFDVEFPCEPGIGWLEVVINWSTPAWPDPAAPPFDDVFIERAPDPPMYFTDPGHYEFEMMLPYCPAWVSMDVRGYDYVITGTIYHVCQEPEPPPNDDCINAMPIGDVVDLPFDTTYATFDGPGHCQTAPNVWYCYTATCTGMLSVDTCGSLYDTKIAVYDGCECYPTYDQMLCCNDDDCCEGRYSVQSRCTVWVEAGREYLIEVGGYYYTYPGPGDLTVQCHPADYYFNGGFSQGGGNGWPYPEAPGEWIYYPSGWWNMWWPNEFDMERVKVLYIEFDVDFPCYADIPDGWLEVVVNWSTPDWDMPYEPPFDDIFIERAPDPPMYITEPGHYQLQVILPYCPWWVSVDVRGEYFIINGGIRHECVCFGDLNGDNCITLADLAQLLSNYGCASGCNYWDGDLDGDGDVDLSDLAALLARYGMCCP